MTTIFHIASRADWEAAVQAGRYEAESLRSEGFIHFSTRDQVVDVANRRFQARTDLLLLRIDADRVCADLRYEQGADVDELFPHFYGPLNLDAVTSADPLLPSADGTFAAPAGLGPSS